jgi:predicted CopG family antitoxin
VEKIGTAPKIKYLEGVGWLEKLFADFANTTENMRVILWTPKQHKKSFSAHIWRYRLLRKKRWLISRRIVTADGTDSKKELVDDKRYGRKTVVIQDFPLPIHADINIYWPGKVSILFFDKNDIPQAIIIENKEVYTTLVGIFEYIWKLHTPSKSKKIKK